MGAAPQCGQAGLTDVAKLPSECQASQTKASNAGCSRRAEVRCVRSFVYIWAGLSERAEWSDGWGLARQLGGSRVAKHDLPLSARPCTSHPENSMRRMPIPSLVIAVTLAVLLPLEQAHCAWMGLQKHVAPVAATAPLGHECCESAPAPETDHHSKPEGVPQGCTCAQLPVVTLPTVVAAGSDAPPVTSIAVLTVLSVIVPVSMVTETVPALDVGSPPLPDDPGAHGLRAPPVSA
jgi:hypothetical protein